jgi:hypothetical protein
MKPFCLKVRVRIYRDSMAQKKYKSNLQVGGTMLVIIFLKELNRK